MFAPNYTVSPRLLEAIKRVTEVVTRLNDRRFPHTVLLQMEREAREISAFHSTSIEGNPLPLTDVKRLLKQEPAHIRDTEREVLNYNRALLWLEKAAAQKSFALDVSSLQKIHGLVTQNLLSRLHVGKLRKAPVFVNDPRKQETIFLPPDHQDVPRLTKELVTFVQKQRDKLDPLILAGLFHKQFVLIHPFLDGNGRTVRLATKSLLANLGINTFPLFSFERYYNQNVTKYFSFVGERGNYYDLGVDFTPWLEYFTEGVLDELLRVQKELDRISGAPHSGIKPHHQTILNYLRERGSITDALYAAITDRSKPSRANDFRFLVEQGFIKRNGGGRSTYYTIVP